MNYLRAELLDRLASEYVLGTLRGAARRRFERVLAESASAKAAVRDWQERLAPLAQAVTAVAPPDRVWRGIAERTAPRRATRTSGWHHWIRPLAGFGLGALLVAGVLLIAPDRVNTLTGLEQIEPILPQRYLALLSDATGDASVVASSTRNGTRMYVKFLKPVDLPRGKTLQLWALPAGAAPFPLGRFASVAPPGKAEFDLVASSEELLSKVPRLMLTLEDEAAPVPRAPSAALLTGPCIELW